jgi:hypothetical protein
MKTIRAVTNRHPVFLNQAYALDGIVDLVDDERHLGHGERYINFDRDGLVFVVYIKTTDGPIKAKTFTNLRSAVNYARRV